MLHKSDVPPTLKSSVFPPTRSLSTSSARAYLEPMNAILSPILLAAMMLAEPVWAGCPQQKYLSIPKVIDLPYPKARTSSDRGWFSTAP